MLLSTPAAVRRADDLLPEARALVDRSAELRIADTERPISCRAGCSACCSQPVPVSSAELRSVQAAIDQLPADIAEGIRERTLTVGRSLAEAGLDHAAFAATDPGPDRVALVHRYLALDLACPLLIDGVCSVREARPLACREYLVTSDPTHCSTPEDGQVVRIRTDPDVVSGFRQVSAALGEPTEQILALALAGPTPTAPEVEPRSGPALAQALRSVPLAR